MNSIEAEFAFPFQYNSRFESEMSDISMEENSVYLIYIVAIDEYKNIQTRLCSMYNRQLLSGTRIIKHWAGRNSRGVTQYEGVALENIIEQFDYEIDYDDAQNFLTACLDA